MKAELAISNPDDLEATVTLTATVGEFRELKLQLSEAKDWISPLAQLRDALGSTIEKAEKHFYGGASNPP